VIIDTFGKLYNEGGEIVAEGNCQVDYDHSNVTMRPIVDTPLMNRQHGTLRLVLDDGSELPIAAERVTRFRLNAPGVPPGAAYRLYFTNQPGAQPAGDGGAT
jgi:hypothetical protein